MPDRGLCCDDDTYCPFGQKYVGITGCAPAASSEPGSISSSPVSGRSSASLQSGSVTGAPTSSSYDYGSAISEYISVVTELSQLIVTSTASNGSTAVTTEQVPYTTTTTVYANTAANASAEATPTLTISSGGTTASSSSSGVAKVGGCWSGAAVDVTVIAIAIASAIFTLQ